MDWTFGIPEAAFAHRKPKLGLITKTEVRVISLSKMALREKSVVWDIGAGSGSVSIESALIARAGRVFAIEKNEEDIGLIQENIKRFGTSHVEAIHAKAPDRLDTLPSPDAVFIGGSGSRMEEILEICWERLNEKGRLVVNLATIENLSEADHFFKSRGIRPEVTLVQVGRGSEILDLTRFDALNPVFILRVEKGMSVAPPPPGVDEEGRI
jgi:precorrin-6Y C5,15-methyltransferase (decarboxylating)